MLRGKNNYSKILRNFRISLSLRVILITLTAIAISASYVSSWPVASIILLVALLKEVHSLFRYVDQTNSKLTRFLVSIKYSDFTSSIPNSGMGGSFRELEGALNEVLSEFRRIRNEKEEHARFLQTVIQHIGLGLISFQQDGKVELINNSAKRLLRVNTLLNINSLQDENSSVLEKLRTIRSGEKVMVKFADNNELTQLLLHATEFKRQDKMYKLVSVQNIQRELDEKEMEAWQKLISVLTHEIMNSITPISSLSQTIEGLLKNCAQPQDCLEDIKTGVHTIHKRSEGLIKFVNNYRTLTRIPVPDYSIVNIGKLFFRVQKLLEGRLRENNISFSCSVEPESLELTIDEKLIEQVLLNLIINSVEAVKEKEEPVIELNALMGESGQIFIQVKDNGNGILEEVQDKIFIPFFTTKENGSGIGLSLARQIMRQHHGAIRVFSRPEEYTIFTLVFNN
ncbi:MAG: GHKL domain-containing protein [Ignavibacteria bacterium]|jgi:nitrogen fixation/metabolism regulation signal transduction histidine kinase|nr:GHKL domain-containing protein [Ignavibacteria bacterium]MCU7504750.1 GHKL domain-containing protein [Ignavibacteria bacterium]MCU7516352.1 GHKL domain-containing protein [Ignavibacteria bacterium]